MHIVKVKPLSRDGAEKLCIHVIWQPNPADTQQANKDVVKVPVRFGSFLVLQMLPLAESEIGVVWVWSLYTPIRRL